LDGEDILGLAAVGVPRSHEALPVVGHGVETPHAFEVELVDEAYFAAVVNSQGPHDEAGDRRHLASHHNTSRIRGPNGQNERGGYPRIQLVRNDRLLND
jgi:hypothetical protein